MSFFGAGTPDFEGKGGGFLGSTPVAATVKTWTQVVTGFETGPPSFGGVVLLNGNWLVGFQGLAGANPSILTSPDLVTFTKRTLNAGLTNYSQTVGAFGAGVYVVLGTQAGNNRIFSSADLVTWTTVNSTMLTAIPGNVAFGNSIFVNGDSNTGRYETSPDGVTWTARSAYVPHRWGRIIFDGAQFVAVVINSASSPMMVTSPDGINWTEQGAALTINATSLAYNGSLYVMGNPSDDSGESRTTPAAVSTTFSFNDSGFSNFSAGLAAGGGSWARVNNRAIASDGAQSSSTGNSGWQEDVTPVTTQQMNVVTFGNSLFVASGSAATLNLLMKRSP